MEVSKSMGRIFRIARDTKGQDLIEYACMAAFLAFAAGVCLPEVADSVGVAFSQIGSVLTAAAGQVQSTGSY